MPGFKINQLPTARPPRHAIVSRDGYAVPLIGIQPSATEEECDRCCRKVHFTQIRIQPEGFPAYNFLCFQCYFILQAEESLHRSLQ